MHSPGHVQRLIKGLAKIISNMTPRGGLLTCCYLCPYRYEELRYWYDCLCYEEELRQYHDYIAAVEEMEYQHHHHEVIVVQFQFE